MSESQFRIEDGPLGTQMIVFSEWTANLRSQFLRNNVVDLHLRSPRCIPIDGLSFLCDFKWLKGVTVFKTNVDIAPLECLHELRRLQLIVSSKHVLKFGAFPNLCNLSVNWDASIKELIHLRTLKKLFIDHPSKLVIPHIGQMTDLEDLALLSCPAEDLTPLGNLQNLKKLRIASFRKNSDNTFVSQLVNLEEYFIQDSKGFSSLEPLRDLRKLESVVLEDCGPLDSLEPLVGNQTLTEFVICGARTEVLDGDYSPVEDLPQLQRYFR